MVEHGVRWENVENMENIEKDGKHQPDDLKHSIYNSKHKSINQIAPTLFFTAFTAPFEKS